MGNMEHLKLCQNTEQQLTCKEREYENLHFSRFEIETKYAEFVNHQYIYIYISKIKELYQDATDANFRSLGANLPWPLIMNPKLLVRQII